jgi:hypothetical protein
MSKKTLLISVTIDGKAYDWPKAWQDYIPRLGEQVQIDDSRIAVVTRILRQVTGYDFLVISIFAEPA